MPGANPLANPPPDVSVSDAAARSVQGPLPSRVKGEENVLTTIQYLDLSSWVGSYVRIVSTTDLHYLLVESGTPATVPTTALESGDGCMDFLPANTPDFFVVHPERRFLAYIGAAAGTKLRVSRR